jgi:hypothetical protein
MMWNISTITGNRPARTNFEKAFSANFFYGTGVAVNNTGVNF